MAKRSASSSFESTERTKKKIKTEAKDKKPMESKSKKSKELKGKQPMKSKEPESAKRTEKTVGDTVKAKGVEMQYSNNRIISPRFIDWEYFKSSEYPFREWFKFQKWVEFIKTKLMVYERLVR